MWHILSIFKPINIKCTFKNLFVHQIMPQYRVTKDFLQNNSNIFASQIISIQSSEVFIVSKYHIDYSGFIAAFQLLGVFTPCFIAVCIVTQIHKVIMQIVVALLIFDHVFFAPNLLLPEKSRNLPSKFLTGHLICCRCAFGKVRTSAPMAAGKIVDLHKSAMFIPQLPVVQINIKRPVVLAFEFSELCSNLNFLLLCIIKNPEHYTFISGKVEHITHHHLNLTEDFFRQGAKCILNFIKFVFVEVQTFQTLLFHKKHFQNVS